MDPPPVPPSQMPAVEGVVLHSIERASTVEFTVDPFLYYTPPGKDSQVDSTATGEIKWSDTPNPLPGGRIPPTIRPTPAPTESKTPTMPMRVSKTPAMPARESKTLAPKRAPASKVTEAEQLILMDHVTQHMGEWTQGKSVFWNKVSRLFQEDTGKFDILNEYIFILIFYRQAIKIATINSQRSRR
jgi:hypothetical protein